MRIVCFKNSRVPEVGVSLQGAEMGDSGIPAQEVLSVTEMLFFSLVTDNYECSVSWGKKDVNHRRIFANWRYSMCKRTQFQSIPPHLDRSKCSQ